MWRGGEYDKGRMVLLVELVRLSVRMGRLESDNLVSTRSSFLGNLSDFRASASAVASHDENSDFGFSG